MKETFSYYELYKNRGLEAWFPIMVYGLHFVYKDWYCGSIWYMGTVKKKLDQI